MRHPRAEEGPGAAATGSRTPLAVAAAGLLLVLAVLVSTVLSVSGGDDGGDRADREGTRPATAAPARHAAPAAPEPEICADGTNPAESLRPDGRTGDALKRIQDAGELVVGVDQNSYLWGFRNPATRDLEGFDIDLVKAIAEDLLGDSGKVRYKAIPTDQRIPAIQDGKVDMVVRTMTINCDRIEQVAFSTAYFESGQQLLVPRNSSITGLNGSVEGKRICNARGSTAEALLKRSWPDAEQIKVANQLDCLVRLQLGEADAILTDSALAAGQAAQDPAMKLVGEPATIEPYGVAMNRADDDLVRRVNKVLEDYREGGDDSLWQQSYDHWLADMMGRGKDSLKPPKPLYRD